jgi:hypothetical protein
MFPDCIAKARSSREEVFLRGLNVPIEKTHRLKSVLPKPMNPYWIFVGFPSCLQLYFFLRWLHRRTRDDEIRRAFVRDMAINHLPHLYHALRQIAGHLGLELKEPPPVQFLELNGHDRKR